MTSNGESSQPRRSVARPRQAYRSKRAEGNIAQVSASMKAGKKTLCTDTWDLLCSHLPTTADAVQEQTSDAQPRAAHPHRSSPGGGSESHHSRSRSVDMSDRSHSTGSRASPSPSPLSVALNLGGSGRSPSGQVDGSDASSEGSSSPEARRESFRLEGAGDASRGERGAKRRNLLSASTWDTSRRTVSPVRTFGLPSSPGLVPSPRGLGHTSRSSSGASASSGGHSPPQVHSIGGESPAMSPSSSPPNLPANPDPKHAWDDVWPAEADMSAHSSPASDHGSMRRDSMSPSSSPRRFDVLPVVNRLQSPVPPSHSPNHPGGSPHAVAVSPTISPSPTDGSVAHKSSPLSVGGGGLRASHSSPKLGQARSLDGLPNGFPPRTLHEKRRSGSDLAKFATLPPGSSSGRVPLKQASPTGSSFPSLCPAVLPASPRSPRPPQLHLDTGVAGTPVTTSEPSSSSLAAVVASPTSKVLSPSAPVQAKMDAQHALAEVSLGQGEGAAQRSGLAEKLSGGIAGAQTGTGVLGLDKGKGKRQPDSEVDSIGSAEVNGHPPPSDLVSSTGGSQEVNISPALAANTPSPSSPHAPPSALPPEKVMFAKGRSPLGSTFTTPLEPESPPKTRSFIAMPPRSGYELSDDPDDVGSEEEGSSSGRSSVDLNEDDRDMSDGDGDEDGNGSASLMPGVNDLQLTRQQSRMLRDLPSRDEEQSFVMSDDDEGEEDDGHARRRDSAPPSPPSPPLVKDAPSQRPGMAPKRPSLTRSSIVAPPPNIPEPRFDSSAQAEIARLAAARQKISGSGGSGRKDVVGEAADDENVDMEWRGGSEEEGNALGHDENEDESQQSGSFLALMPAGSQSMSDAVANFFWDGDPATEGGDIPMDDGRGEESLSTLERIFLFAKSEMAYHRCVSSFVFCLGVCWCWVGLH